MHAWELLALKNALEKEDPNSTLRLLQDDLDLALELLVEKCVEQHLLPHELVNSLSAKLLDENVLQEPTVSEECFSIFKTPISLREQVLILKVFSTYLHAKRRITGTELAVRHQVDLELLKLEKTHLAYIEHFKYLLVFIFI